MTGRRFGRIAIVAVLGAAACSGGSSEPPDSTEPEATEVPPTGSGDEPQPTTTVAPVVTTLPPEPVIAAGVWVGAPGALVHVDPSGGVIAEVSLNEVRPSVAYGAGSVWAGDYDQSVVHRVDPETAEILETISLPGPPGATTFADDSLWISLYDNSAIAKVDASDNSVTEVALDADPTGISAGPLIVGSNDAETLTRFDGDGTEQLRVTIPGGVSRLASEDDQVWATSQGDQILEIDPDTLGIIGRILIDGFVRDLVLGDGVLWVAEADRVLRIEDGTVNIWATIGGIEEIAFGDGYLFTVDDQGVVYRVATDRPDDLTVLADLDGDSFSIGYAPAHTADGTIVPAAAIAVPDDADGQPAELEIGQGWQQVVTGDEVFGGPGDQSIAQVVSFDGGFVAAGRDGTGPNDRPALWYSPDGTTWERTDLSAGYDLSRPQAITELAVGPGGVVAAGWERRGCDRELWSVTDFDACDQYVAVIWHSPNGKQWTRVAHDPGLFESDSALFPQALVGTSSQWVMLGSEPSRSRPRLIVWTSPDGVTWNRTVGDEGVPIAPDDIAVAPDGTLVALGHEYDNDFRCNSAFRPCRFWVTTITVSVNDYLDGPPDNGTASLIWTSADGSNWTRHRPVWAEPPLPEFQPNLSETGRLIVVGDRLVKTSAVATYSSPDGLTWQVVSHGEQDVPSGAAGAGGAGIVNIGPGMALPRAATSLDGTTWTELTSEAGARPQIGDRRIDSVALTDEIWVAAGSDSAGGDGDGAIWFSVAGPAPQQVTDPVTTIGPCWPGRSRTCLDLDVSGMDLAGVSASGVTFVRATMAGADLSGADLRGADLTGANLFGANLSGARLGGAILVNADLRGADLTGADLRSSSSMRNLSGADLRGADLTGANLRNADLSNADGRGAVFRDAVLVGATLFRRSA